MYLEQLSTAEVVEVLLSVYNMYLGTWQNPWHCFMSVIVMPSFKVDSRLSNSLMFSEVESVAFSA